MSRHSFSGHVLQEDTCRAACDVVNSTNAKRMAELGSPQTRQSMISPQDLKNTASCSSVICSENFIPKGQACGVLKLPCCEMNLNESELEGDPKLSENFDGRCMLHSIPGDQHLWCKLFSWQHFSRATYSGSLPYVLVSSWHSQTEQSTLAFPVNMSTLHLSMCSNHYVKKPIRIAFPVRIVCHHVQHTHDKDRDKNGPCL